MENLLSALIKKFGPGMPTRKRNRVLRVKLHGKKDYYKRFVDSISESFENDLWALIVDISGIGIKELKCLMADIPHFTTYSKKRKIPTMISLSIEQAGALNRKDWGMLVKGFEIKDLVVDLRPEGILGCDLEEVRRLVRKVNDMIMSGKNLEAHMNTHYSHSSFIMTIQLDENTTKDEKNLSIIRELRNLDLDKFRLSKQFEGGEEKGSDRLICDILEKSGKRYLDESDRFKSNIEITKEYVEIGSVAKGIDEH